MKKNIYDEFNDMTIDLSELKQEEFTALERKRAMKKFKASINKHSSYKKCAGVAIALAISAGTLGSAPVFAGTNPVMHSIAGFLGIEKELESYTTAVNQSVTKGDVTIQLNEVILDEKELIVSTTITSKEPLEEMGVDASGSVYINGKRISWGAAGGSRQIDDYTVEEVMNYHLDEEYTGEMDMTLLFNGVRVNGMKQKGRWKFEFSTSGDELKLDTVNTEINQACSLPDETKIIFTQYTSNDIGEKIYFTKSKAETSYDLELRGTDNMGNPIVFSLSNSKGTQGVLKLNEFFSDKDEDATSYTLALYAVKFPVGNGKLSNDFKQVGEEFTVKLK